MSEAESLALLGPAVREAVVASGRRLRYIDDGASDGPVLLFFGGAGTTVQAFGLTEFVQPLREELGIRVVSVERNGLGLTPFDPTVGPAEYAADVWSLLDGLSVEQVSVVAVSGGGPYAAALMAAQPDRIASVHLANAYAEPSGEQLAFDVEAVIADPESWWEVPADSPMRAIPGFVEACRIEARRPTSAEGLRHAFRIYASTPLPSLSSLRGPLFIYRGSEDQLVGPAHLHAWQRAFGRPGTVRLYDGEGHESHYTHWDEVLRDVAGVRS